MKNAAKTTVSGGETGIRTLGGLAPTTVFETAPFDRSGTSPQGWESQLLDKAIRRKALWHGIERAFAPFQRADTLRPQIA